MFDPVLRFRKSAAPAPAPPAVKYAVQWTRNGAPAGAGEILRDGTADSLGYSVKFSQHNPGAFTTSGETIAATLTAIDAAGQPSAAATPSLPLPTVPPGMPEAVTLTLS